MEMGPSFVPLLHDQIQKEEESNQQHSGIIHFFCFCHNHFRLRSRRRNKEIMEYLSGEKNQNASLGQTAKVLGWYS